MSFTFVHVISLLHGLDPGQTRGKMMGSVEDGLDSLFVWPKGQTIRKIMGGGGEEGWVGNFWAAGIFFSLSNSSYEFFLGCSMSIFYG